MLPPTNVINNPINVIGIPPVLGNLLFDETPEL